MQRLEASCAVRRIYTSLGAKGLTVLISETEEVYFQLCKNGILKYMA